MKDRWDIFPRLNKKRYFHSSCTLGTSLYVLGGFENNNRLTNSIEKLEDILEQLPSGLYLWQGIDLMLIGLCPRY